MYVSLSPQPTTSPHNIVFCAICQRAGRDVGALAGINLQALLD